MTTAGGMQVMSSDHHGLHHHGHHPHACMLGVPNSPFSPAFSFASSSVTGASSSHDLSAWPHQLGVLNCSSSSAPAASACNSQLSCSSNATACTFPASSRCFPSSCTGASTSSTSSPSSNLTQAPSPHPLMNSSSSSSHAPGALSPYGDLGVYDASAMLPASDADAAAAAAAGDASASAPAAASQSELPSAVKSTAAAPAGSPNNSVNAPAPAASPTSGFNFQFRPTSPYTAGGGGVDEVDAFLKDAQSSDMEQFLLELLQQPASAAPNSSTGSNTFFGTNQTEQPAGMQMQMRNTGRQQQQQQAAAAAAAAAASTYQSLMEMALDSSPTFMDATVTAAPDTHSPSFSYMESEQQQRSKSSFGSGGVKPSFVVSPTNNNNTVGNSNNPGQALYSSSNTVVSTFMDTSSDSNAYSTGLGSGSSNNNHRTFLEAMSSRGGSGAGVSSSQQPDQWMNVGSKGAASEVDELEKEFMRIYGGNVNLRMGGGGRMVKVESEPNILHLRDRMDSVTSFTSSHDHHQFESAEGDTVMLELDPIPISMNHPLPDGSGSMNQLMADTLVSSGMDLGFQQHSHGGILGLPFSTGLSDNPTLQLQHQHQHGHHLSGSGAGGGMGFLSHSGMGSSSGLSSSWPGGAAGSAGYKHYPQPLAQLKSNKMSVSFMAAQPASNSSTLALVQAFAPASTAASSTSSPGYGRRFLSSHSLPNLQQLPASQPVLQLGDMGGQLNRSNSLPSQRTQGSSGTSTSTSTSHAPSPLGAGASAAGNPYLSHSMSFPAGSLLGQHAHAHAHPHAQHKPASNSYQQLASEFHPLQVSSNSLQYRPAHLYRTHNPNAPNSGGMELQDLAGSVVSAAVPDPAVMAMGLQLVHLLLACAEAVADDNMELAHVLLERLSTLVAPLGSPIQRLAAYFAEALAARVTRKTRSDLFRGLHGDRSIPKTEKLEALSVLYDCIPTGKFGHLTSNQVLLDAIENDQNVHLIDLHIWYGMQWPAFFQALATREGGPPNLRISAVGSSYEELKETGETLQECAKQLNLPLEYCPIVVPLEEFNIRLLELRRGEVCVVNSFCQLHCLLHKGADNFNRILRGLRSLNPKVFALTENDGNHNSPHFPARFMACLHYYSAVFDAFDSSLPHDSPARMKIEQLFAAQKIRNIIACEGTDRVERHESMTEWAKRMEAAGFSPVPLSSRAVSQADLLLNLYYSNNYTLANNSGYLGLRWSSMPLMGVSAWR